MPLLRRLLPSRLLLSLTPLHHQLLGPRRPSPSLRCPRRWPLRPPLSSSGAAQRTLAWLARAIGRLCLLTSSGKRELLHRRTHAFVSACPATVPAALPASPSPLPLGTHRSSLACGMGGVPPRWQGAFVGLQLDAHDAPHPGACGRCVEASCADPAACPAAPREPLLLQVSLKL